MRRFTTLLLAAALTLGACSESQSASAAAKTTTVAVKPDITPIAERNGNWRVSPKDSYLKFSTTQEGEPFTGEFPQFSAVINFDPTDVEAATVLVQVPLLSVKAGSTDRNSTLPGKLWFNAKAFPLAQFASKTIAKTGENTYLAKGELTLKGKAVPLDLPFLLTFENGQALMSAQVTLDRTLWGIGEAPWDTDEWVGKAVTLDIKVTANNPS